MTEEKKVEINAENLDEVSGGRWAIHRVGTNRIEIKGGSTGDGGKWTMPNDHRPAAKEGKEGGGGGSWEGNNPPDNSSGNTTNIVTGNNNKVYQQGKNINIGGNSINNF